MPRDQRITPEHAEQFLKTRRSARVYEPTLVDQALTSRALVTAANAPSGHNRQPVDWTVISGPLAVNALSAAIIGWMRESGQGRDRWAALFDAPDLIARWESGEGPILRRAPHVVVAHAQTDDFTAASSATIAITYLQLAAHALGLATCWVGYLAVAAGRAPSVNRLVQMPPSHKLYAATLLGYAAHEFALIPARKPPVITWQG